MVWTSRLALIAYLLGGWLLPALHRHDHAHHAVEACHEEVISSPSAHCCDHGHAHHSTTETGSEESESEKTEPDSLEPQVAAAHPVLLCEGLCALCSARSIKSITFKQKPSSILANAPPQRIVVIEPAFPLARAAHQHLSRGPPTAA